MRGEVVGDLRADGFVHIAHDEGQTYLRAVARAFGQGDDDLALGGRADLAVGGDAADALAGEVDVHVRVDARVFSGEHLRGERKVDVATGVDGQRRPRVNVLDTRAGHRTGDLHADGSALREQFFHFIAGQGVLVGHGLHARNARRSFERPMCRCLRGVDLDALDLPIHGLYGRRGRLIQEIGAIGQRPRQNRQGQARAQQRNDQRLSAFVRQHGMPPSAACTHKTPPE